VQAPHERDKGSRKLNKARAVKRFINRLEDKRWLVRCRAADALGKLGDARAVESLIDCLSDRKGHVRRAAADALGKLGDARAVEPLIIRVFACLENKTYVRRAAAEALGKLGDARAVEPLIDCLEDYSPRMRFDAAEALVKIGAPAVEPLIDCLETNSDARLIIILALVKIGAPAVEPLVDGLKHADSAVRLAAAEALRELKWQAQTQEQQAAYLIASQAWDEVVQLGAPAVAPLIRRLWDSSSAVRRATAEALGKLGDERAVEPLIDCLWDEDWRVSCAAAEALGKLGDERAVEPLIDCLWDNDWHVSCAAAEALGKLDDRRAVKPLIACLRDESQSVRRAAAEALGKLGDERAVEPLIARLWDESRYVSCAAIKALGKLGDERAVEPLIDYLQDTDEDVRLATAEALRELKWQAPTQELHIVYLIAAQAWDELVQLGAPSVEPLIDCLDSSSGEIRRAAAAALGRLDDARVLEPLIACLSDHNWYVRHAAAEGLVKIGAPAVEPLIACLEDERWSVRYTAAQALGGMKWQALNYEQQTAYLTAKCAWDELVEIGAPAVPPLIARLERCSGSLRRVTAEALGRLGDKRAIAPLIACLQDADEDEDVRSAVSWALRQLGYTESLNLPS
jgi:HEAT repeat protein